MLISSFTILCLPFCIGIFPNFYICYIFRLRKNMQLLYIFCPLLSTILIFEMVVVCNVIECCFLFIQLYVILTKFTNFLPFAYFPAIPLPVVSLPNITSQSISLWFCRHNEVWNGVLFLNGFVYKAKHICDFSAAVLRNNFV